MTDEQRLFLDDANEIVERLYSDLEELRAARIEGKRRRQLADVLAGLSARDRDVLLLVAWGELSYEEVAGVLGIPVGTVRSRLNRSRRKLRATLNGVEPLSAQEVSDRG